MLFRSSLAIDQIISGGSLSQSSISYFGSIDDTDYANLNLCSPIPCYSDETNVFGVNNVEIGMNDLENDENDSWFYAMFDNVGSCNYSGYSFFTVVDNIDNSWSTTDEFSGVVSGNLYTYSGVSYCDYDNMVVATLRSRGLATYVGTDRKSTRLNSSHSQQSRMPSSA